MSGWGSTALAAVLTAAAPASAAAEPVTTFVDPAIEESSGLVDRGAYVLTVNDSGDDPVVYVVEKATGRTVGRTVYSAGEVVDVEALAPGPGGSVWVGDIGDNRGRRDRVTVYRLAGVGPGDGRVAATRYDLVYPDGPRDAEALLVHPRSGRLYLVTKGLLGGAVYRAPAVLRPGDTHRLRQVARAPGLVTDGVFTADGRRVLLRDYGGLTVHAVPSFRVLARMDLPDQPQGEGLATTLGARVLVSSEGEGTPVLSVPFTPEVRLAVEGRGTPGGAAGPDPGSLGDEAAGSPAPASSGERGEPGGADAGTDVKGLVAMAVAVLVVVLGVRTWFRERDRRRR